MRVFQFKNPQRQSNVECSVHLLRSPYLRLHTREKHPVYYLCTFCDLKFREQAKLRIHLLNDHDVKCGIKDIYICWKCKKSCTSFKELGPDYVFLIFFQFFRFVLTREPDTQKKIEKFCKTSVLNDEIIYSQVYDTRNKFQLISKYPFGVITWTKIPTNIFENVCPRF